MLPMELVTSVETDRSRYTWFPDQLTLHPRFEPAFSDEDLERVATLRSQLGKDIIYPADKLPQPDILPDTAQILAIHNSFVLEQELADQSCDTLFLSVVNASENDVRTSATWLEEFRDWKDAVQRSDEWLYQLHLLLSGSRIEDQAVITGILTLAQEWTELVEASSNFRLQGISLPPVTLNDTLLDAALEALSKGEKPFGLFSFGKSGTKTQIEAIRLAGRTPQSSEQWQVVAEYRRWQVKAGDFAARWSAAARALQLVELPEHETDDGGELCRLGRLVATMLSLRDRSEEVLASVQILFPQGIDAKRVVVHGESAEVLLALKLHLAKQTNADTHRQAKQLRELAQTGNQPFYAALQNVCEALPDPIVSVQELANAWNDVIAEAIRLQALFPLKNELETIVFNISNSGAPLWAQQLSQQPATATDPWLNSHWKSAWNWARAAGFIDQLPGRGDIGRLSAHRKALEDEQKRLMGEIVRIRTFIGLKQNITERVAAALAQFALQVRQLGAGTGLSAGRHRRGIREAAIKAAEAVPCWILPEWRVAEQLPDTLGFFDLVIIDEASQSDITALPAIMRGKKLLIVGDDKQVSPTSIGLQERTIIELRETYLRDLPIANHLDPTTSIYDLVSMTFPGSTILLREHYRCVEPIIRFSSRFYPKALIPLRIPTASERLEPPLIDVYLPHGSRGRKEVNEAEADYIVSEIMQLVEDPAYKGRSIGVISLIGDKQAKLIQDLLTEKIGNEAIVQHRIMCGNAATFQGQERDIMFLSMVACPENGASANGTYV